MNGVDVAGHGFAPPDRRIALDQAYAQPHFTRWYMQHVREISGTADVSARGRAVTELAEQPRNLDSVHVSRAGGGRWTIAEMLAAAFADAIMVLRGGRIVYERYFGGMRPETPHLTQSVTKALASCVAANLVEAGTISLGDQAAEVVPELAGSAYADATVRHLLDMTVGIRYCDDLDRPEYDGARLCRLQGVLPRVSGDEPGSAYGFAAQAQKRGEHGAVFHYVSLNTVVLGWLMERATGVGVPELIRAHVWGKLGAAQDAYIALDGAGSAQLDGGFACSLRDLARFGQMLCQQGHYNGQQVIPAWWVDDITHNGDQAVFAAAARAWPGTRSWRGCSYRSGFWVCESGDHVAFSAAGWLGQRVYVSQETGVVVAMFSARPPEADQELDAHVVQACHDLTRLLA